MNFQNVLPLVISGMRDLAGHKGSNSILYCPVFVVLLTEGPYKIIIKRIVLDGKEEMIK